MGQLFTNNARALLASGITDTATSITVEAAKADLFPTANVNTGSVPSVNNWFKATLQDSMGNVEIIYVRTRNAGSGIFSNVLRGQEGTTARAFSAGAVCGVRITAADVEGSIAAASNSVQLTGNQTIDGTKTFSQQIVASVTGNAGTVTNGVYTTGDQSIGGIKTFTSVMAANGNLAITNVAPLITLVESDQTSPAGRRRLVQDGNAFTLRRNTAAAGDFSTEVNDITSDASGNFTASGNVTAYSDIRLKTDLTKIADALAKINQLNGYTYTRRDTGERHAGVVAQEVEAVLPEVVHRNDNGTLSVAYGNMVGLLIEAIKEQSRVIDALTARVEKLEGR